ncbi:YfhO family protein [uncultured Granulicatella sp.]|uniref:YfhO family protein n=1 Tax=uncultured Granulicatella sp. TaxID=316089 RepID=UPI0028D7FFA3|nr:YfhO family protein [uncultured Granulicatella sp.]
MEKTMTKKRYYTLSILIPAVMILAIFLLFTITPFGNRTWLTIDLGQQYVDFFSYFQDTLLHHPEQFFYSFSKSIGGEMVSLWAYYLLSPFNLLFLLIPRSAIAMGVSLLIFLKLVSCTVSFAVLLDVKFKQRNWTTLLFALSYGFMSYLSANQFNVMWLDALIGLPLVILGVDALLQKRNPLYYVLPLSLTILSNYYTGYMICLFLGLYFPYAYLMANDSFSWKSFIKQFGRFIFYSVLAVGLIMVILLPTFYSLLGSKGTATTIAWSLKSEYNPLLMVSKLFIGSFDFHEMQKGYPNIFVGSLAMFSFLCYFKEKKIALSQRLYALFITVIILISFNIEMFDKLWHAGQLPNWYSYRFSFLFSFWMVFLGYQWAMKKTVVGIRETFVYFFLVLGASIGFILFPQDYLQGWQIALGFGLSMGILYSLILIGRGKRAHQKFLISFVVIELLLNSIITLSRLGYVMNSEFTAYQSSLQNWSTVLRPAENEFYRSEKTMLRSKNDSLQVPTYGVSHFSSTFEKETEKFFDAIGVRQGTAYVNYSNGTLLTDALLGIKNTFIETTDATYNERWERKDLEDFSTIASFDEGHIVTNPNTLSIAYPMKAILKSMKVPTNHPITMQNQLANALSGTTSPKNIFTKVPYETTFENISDSPVVYQRVQFEDNTQVGTITLTFTPETDDPIYLEMAGTMGEEDLEMTLNGEPYAFYPVQSKPVLLSVAKNQKGQPQTLQIIVKSDGFEFSKLNLYSLNTTLLNERLEKTKAQELKLENFSATEFSGTMEVSEDSTVLTAIPYSTGWKVWVDGQEVETYKILDSLLGFTISKGIHRIEYRYSTPFLLEGSLVSIASLLLLIFILYRRKKTVAS